MPVLHLTLKDGERHIPFAPGLSVREIIDTADIRVRSACEGVGACGLCRVRIEAGTGGNPTANELINLSPDQMQRGIRLACQIKPLQAIRIAIETPSPTTNWRSLDEDDYTPTVVLTTAVTAVKQDGISTGVAGYGDHTNPAAGTYSYSTNRGDARGQPEWMRDVGLNS